MALITPGTHITLVSPTREYVEIRRNPRSYARTASDESFIRYQRN